MLNDNLKRRTALVKDRPYKLTDHQDLYLEVKPNGVKAWRYRFELDRAIAESDEHIRGCNASSDLVEPSASCLRATIYSQSVNGAGVAQRARCPCR